MQPSFDGSQGASETPDTGTGRPGAAPRGGSCVVLLAPGCASAPEDLVRALERRGLRAAGAGSCFDAMAELVAGARFDAGEDGRIGRGEALIVVEPGAQSARRLEDLLASVEKFLPGAVLWSYEAEASPRLHRLERPAREPEPEIVVKGEAARSAAAAMRNGSPARDASGDGEPTLRLRRTEDDAEPAPAEEVSAPEVEHEDDEQQGLLSAEELSMLLAADDDDEEDRR